MRLINHFQLHSYRIPEGILRVREMSSADSFGIVRSNFNAVLEPADGSEPFTATVQAFYHWQVPGMVLNLYKQTQK